MAKTNLSYSGHTGVINASASVYELTTSGTTRSVRVVLQVYAVDYSGARDGGYYVSCGDSGTEVEVPTYSGFTVTGDAKTIFDETFTVSIERGSSSAYMDLSFEAWLISPSSGERRIYGSITKLTLTAEPEGPEVSASRITLGASTVQMGKKLLISLDRDSPGCTHTLDYSFGGQSGTIATEVGGSHAWTVPDLAGACSDALSGVCTVTCYTYTDDGYVGSTCATVTLTVPDPTIPAVSGSKVTLGSKSSISCKRNSAAFSVKLQFTFKGSTDSIGEGKKDAFSWTPSYGLAKQIPSLTEGTLTLVCTTYNGTAQVGTESCTLRLTVPENDVTRPAFTLADLTLEPVSDLGEAFAGIYMRGKTGLKASFAAQSAYSDIASCTITAGSQSAEGNPAVIDLLSNEADVKVTAKVTDARGFSRTVSTTISVLPYRNPRIIPYSGYDGVVCERAKETGELSADGTFLAIKAGKAFTSVVLEGTEENSCQLRYRWKPNGASEYGDWITLLGEDSAETEVSLLVGNVVSSLQTSYLVQLEAADALGGRHTLTFQIMTEAISFVLYDGPDGAGFGKYPEAPHVVDIASHMTLLVRGRLEVVGSQWVSLGLAAGIYESGHSCGRGAGTGCHYLVWGGSHVYLAFNCSFSWAGTGLVINADPIPEEYRPARSVYSLCPVNDRATTLVSVNPDGYIRAEWVQKPEDSVNTEAMEVTWIDGYLDYWTN